MQIKIIMATQDTFMIDGDEKMTVKMLKENIHSKKALPVEMQILMYHGNELYDDTTIPTMQKSPDLDFIVCLFNTTKKMTYPTQESQCRPSTKEVGTSTSQESFNTQGGGGVPPAINEEALALMISMGYEKGIAEIALTDCNNDVPKAVDYIAADGKVAAPSQPVQATTKPQPQSEQQLEPFSDPFLYLRYHPLIHKARKEFHLNPTKLPDILLKIATSSTELAQLIEAHQESFVTMLNDPTVEELPEEPQPELPARDATQERKVDVEVEVNETEAIAKMIEMGFSESDARKAFDLSGKNVKQAIDRLISQNN